MEYERWAPIYRAIAEELAYPFEREETVAGRLRELLPSDARVDGLGRVTERLRGRSVVVVGLAPGAGPPPVWSLPGPRPALVAADGATRVCLDAGLVPEVVVTDLDGPVPSEVDANARGAIVVIHAHGDNGPELERWVGEFPGELAGTWAGPPKDGLFDVGGFTDGDRAAYLAEAAGASRVVLWGFDFRSVDPLEPDPHKASKLAWAERSIEALARSASVPIERWSRDGKIAPYPSGSSGPSTQ